MYVLSLNFIIVFKETVEFYSSTISSAACTLDTQYFVWRMKEYEFHVMDL